MAYFSTSVATSLSGPLQASHTARRIYYVHRAGAMTPEQHKWVNDLLASHPFLWAKTIPRTPHEYTLRHEWARTSLRRWCG
jgi:hypothetical protein